MTDPESVSALSAEELAEAPKVLLHDHLDGGLRPATVIELAEETGYEGLPETEEQALAQWFYDACNSGSLVRYLDTFEHTMGVMQTHDAIVRVAAEAVEDLANDGVVYAEIRFAPELFTQRGLSLDQAVAAVCEGLREGSSGRNIVARALVDGMRQNNLVSQAFQAATVYRDHGVVGVDIAGPELGFLPSLHREAFGEASRANMHITCHAGEADGYESIWEALHVAGAERLGHGVRIADEVSEASGGGAPRLGRLAQYVLDRQIPLEVAPTSNLQTGIADTYAGHPIGVLHRIGFAVTVNTDNRLMSNCTTTSELAAVSDAFGWGWADVARVEVNAMQAAFLPYEERERLLREQLVPFYAEHV